MKVIPRIGDWAVRFAAIRSRRSFRTISHVISRVIDSTTGLAHPNPLYAVNVSGARLVQPCHPSRVEIDVAGLRPTRLAFY